MRDNGGGIRAPHLQGMPLPFFMPFFPFLLFLSGFSESQPPIGLVKVRTRLALILSAEPQADS